MDLYPSSKRHSHEKKLSGSAADGRAPQYERQGLLASYHNQSDAKRKESRTTLKDIWPTSTSAIKLRSRENCTLNEYAT
eukprot:28387-Eustigmatos_ZCMA.PRE.1